MIALTANNRRNYYRILHVQDDAPAAVIKASYRAMMLKLRLHPDLGGDEWNARVLNEAYSVLSNKAKRLEYDKTFLRKAIRFKKHPPTFPASKVKGSVVGKRTTLSRCHFCGAVKSIVNDYGHIADCSSCSSPLQPVCKPDKAVLSDRVYQRMSHQAPMMYYTNHKNHQARPGIINDLSPLGMQLLVPSKLKSKQVIKICSDVLAATARVSHCRQAGSSDHFRVGVEFITLRFHDNTGTFLSARV